MGDTAISWTHRPGTRGRTWNPVRGCRNVSEGCRNCYAKAQAASIVRMSRGKPSPYDGIVKLHRDGYAHAQWTGEIAFDTERLAEPLRWREPSTVFVDSMADLFYDRRPNEHIAAVFGVMAACPQHTFIVLTKYARRMRAWFEWAERHGDGQDLMRFGPSALLTCSWEACAGDVWGDDDGPFDGLPNAETFGTKWPLPNVWLGVSVENQEAADERIPELLATPAAVRFLSCEPLLGPVDLILRGSRIVGWDEDWKYDTLRGAEWSDPHSDVEDGSSAKLDWLISGCESGPGARPCNVAWLRSLRDQCGSAGVPFFLKQAVDTENDVINGVDSQGRACGVTCGTDSKRKGGNVVERPYLDGRQWLEFPR